MPGQKAKLRVIAFLIVLLFGGTTGVSSSVSGMPIQSREAKDWAEIENLIKKGNQLQAEEGNNPSLVDARLRFFRIVAELFKKHIDKYLDRRSTRYVIAIFRLGRVWEKAGDDRAAIIAYAICDQHEMKNNAFYPKGVRLAPQITIRLDEVIRRQKLEQRTEQQIEIRIRQ